MVTVKGNSLRAARSSCVSMSSATARSERRNTRAPPRHSSTTMRGSNAAAHLSAAADAAADAAAPEAAPASRLLPASP
jgi:hypothetical protein